MKSVVMEPSYNIVLIDNINIERAFRSQDQFKTEIRPFVKSFKLNSFKLSLRF